MKTAAIILALLLCLAARALPPKTLDNMLMAATRIPKTVAGGGSYSDNFNRADGALGANWTVPSGATAMAIASQQVQPGALGFANNLELWTGSTLTGVISNALQVTGSINANAYYGVVQCDSSGNNGYIYFVNGASGTALYTFTSQTAGSSLKTDATAVTSGVVLGMVVRAGSIQCYTNGVLDFTYTGAATTGLLSGFYYTGSDAINTDTMDNAAGAGGF
jgi:hypothetical protein